MKLIFCLDQRDGMLFNNRRLSRDRRVYEDILSLLGNGWLWCATYSLELFKDMSANIHLLGQLEDEPAENDFIFFETNDFEDYLASADGIIIYRWDRIYPSDVKFPMELHKQWVLQRTEAITGNSHKVINREVYVR